MQPELLDVFPLWALFLLAAALLWLAMEGGYRTGTWRHVRYPDEREQPVGAMVTSILGLLALIVAFSGMLLLIADLDRVQEGLIRISQQSLIDVQKTMRSHSQPPPQRQADTAKHVW